MAVENDLLAAFDASNSDVPQLDPTALLDAFDAQAATEGGGLVDMTPKVDTDSFSSIVGRSVDNLQASLGGAVEAIGEATGSQYLQDEGAQFREEQLQEASQYGQPSISSYKQVDWSNASDIGSYFKELGIGGATSVGAVAPAMMAGAKVAPGPLKPIGAMAGAFLASFGLNAGEVQNAIKQVDPNGEHPWSALGAGAGMAALDAVGLGTMVKPFIKNFGKEVVYNQLVSVGVPKEAAIQAVKSAVVEGGTEAGQSIGKDITVANATDTELNVDKVMENAINSAVGGTTVGGVAGGAVGAASAMQNNQNIAGTAADPKRFTEGKKTPRGLAGKTMEVLGGAASAAIEPLARVSPAATEILRKFTPDRTGSVASEPTLFEANDLVVGKYRSFLEPLSGLKGKDLDAAFNDYVLGGTTEPASVIRQTLQTFQQEARDAGLDVGTIENYLPDTLDKKRIAANKEQVIADFAPYFKGDIAATTQVVDAWLNLKEQDRGSNVPKVDRLVKQDPATGEWVIDKSMQKGDPQTAKYKVGQGYIPPKFGHLEEARMFANVPQAVLSKYSKEQTGKAKLQAIHDYLEGGAHRINFAKTFGPTGEKLNGQVMIAIKEAREAGREPTKDEINRIYDLADAYNGMLNRVEDPTLKHILSTTNAVATMAALPLSVLSSLTEVALPAVRGDVKAALVSVIPTINEITKNLARSLFTGVPRTEFSKVASEANISLSAAMNITAERVGDSMMTHGTAKAMRYFFMANGLTYWTHAVRVFAAKTGETIIKRNLYELAVGLPVDSAKGRQYINQLNSIGIPVRTTQDAMALYNPQSMSERNMANTYRVLGIRRFVSQTVLEPNVANTPMWMHDGHYQLLAGLKRYPAAFTNEILPHLYRRVTPSYMGGNYQAASAAVGTLFLVGFILSVGYLQDELKQWAKGAGTEPKDTRSEGQRFTDVVNQTLMPLQMGIISDMFNANRYGSDPVTAVAGPVVGQAVGWINTIGQFVENPDDGLIWRQLYKSTPAAPFKAGKEWITDNMME